MCDECLCSVQYIWVMEAYLSVTAEPVLRAIYWSCSGSYIRDSFVTPCRMFCEDAQATPTHFRDVMQSIHSTVVAGRVPGRLPPMHPLRKPTRTASPRTCIAITVLERDKTQPVFLCGHPRYSARGRGAR